LTVIDEWLLLVGGDGGGGWKMRFIFYFVTIAGNFWNNLVWIQRPEMRLLKK
jgi:hypothetical protein